MTDIQPYCTYTTLCCTRAHYAIVKVLQLAPTAEKLETEFLNLVYLAKTKNHSVICHVFYMTLHHFSHMTTGTIVAGIIIPIHIFIPFYKINAKLPPLYTCQLVSLQHSDNVKNLGNAERQPGSRATGKKIRLLFHVFDHVTMFILLCLFPHYLQRDCKIKNSSLLFRRGFVFYCNFFYLQYFNISYNIP